MSTRKFSIVVEVANGKAIAHGFFKEDAQKANAKFNELRDAKKEAYFFQHPIADKRSKSAEQTAATSEATEQPTVVIDTAPKAKPGRPRKGNSIEGVSLDIE